MRRSFNSFAMPYSEVTPLARISAMMGQARSRAGGSFFPTAESGARLGVIIAEFDGHGFV
jgi:hypothetical protein